MSETKHTPLPWKVDPDFLESIVPASEPKALICSMYDSQFVTPPGRESNARFIVDACNNYAAIKAQRDELLAIVKRFERSEWQAGKWSCPECGHWHEHREADDGTNTAACSIGQAIANAEKDLAPQTEK